MSASEARLFHGAYVPAVQPTIPEGQEMVVYTKVEDVSKSIGNKSYLEVSREMWTQKRIAVQNENNASYLNVSRAMWTASEQV